MCCNMVYNGPFVEFFGDRHKKVPAVAGTFVEPLGVEPRSKQVHCKLSTCLFTALNFGMWQEPDEPTPFLHH